MRADDARGEHRHVHLPGHQHQPGGALRRRLELAFICPTAQGGAIDPSIFVATNGTPWLLWKADGDCCNLPTYIYSQQLSTDGLSTVGPPHELIGATQPWEGGLVEAPSMVQSGNTFWMFYSANLWGTPNYSIGIAECQSVTGPCTKPLDRAWHTSTNSANGQGYGGSEFFEPAGDSSGWCTTASCRDSRVTTPNGASTST